MSFFCIGRRQTLWSGPPHRCMTWDDNPSYGNGKIQVEPCGYCKFTLEPVGRYGTLQDGMHDVCCSIVPYLPTLLMGNWMATIPTYLHMYLHMYLPSMRDDVWCDSEGWQVTRHETWWLADCLCSHQKRGSHTQWNTLLRLLRTMEIVARLPNYWQDEWLQICR